ncbi:hypothetical protein JTB14_022151 [Gonioctena quinquepunctata]|nr:hypothetical protein JTB14_022151 [Gonioctena quinquepunctata]
MAAHAKPNRQTTSQSNSSELTQSTGSGETNSKNKKLAIFNAEQVRSAINDAKAMIPTKNHSNYNKPITGYYTANQKIRTVPRQGYLSVYHLHPETTPEEMVEFMRETAPNIHFQFNLLKSNDYQACYKFAYPLDDASDVFSPDIWLVGATIQRIQHRNRNFPQRINYNNRK